MPVTPVFSQLSASQHAHKLKQINLGSDRQIVHWRNYNDRIGYRQPQGNTFSCYIQGGAGTRRIDGTPQNGWPGAVCIMPHGASSEWEITDPFEFIHLYVDDDELRRLFSLMFDCDARLLELADLTYYHSAGFNVPFQKICRALVCEDHVLAEEAAIEIIGTAFVDDCCVFRKPLPLSGGMTPRNCRLVREFIDQNLARKLLLSELSALVQLSPFHFLRSFRQSCGVTPHVWITHCKIEKAKGMIRERQPMSQISEACGFSSQAHFTRAFKSICGVSPGAYAKATARIFLP